MEIGIEGKHVAILVEDDYEDLELWYPKFRLLEEKAIVSLVGGGKEKYHSKHRYPALADATAGKVDVDGFDAVIIPGGYAPAAMRENPAMVEFVRQAWEMDKVVAAICHGGWMLAAAEIIHGRKVTGHENIKADLEEAGGIFEDRPVVRDGLLITSRKPADLPLFCVEIIQTISSKQSARLKAA